MKTTILSIILCISIYSNAQQLNIIPKPSSVVVGKGYFDLKNQIAKTKKQVDPRINLTFRFIK